MAGHREYRDGCSSLGVCKHVIVGGTGSCFSVLSTGARCPSALQARGALQRWRRKVRAAHKEGRIAEVRAVKAATLSNTDA